MVFKLLFSVSIDSVSESIVLQSLQVSQVCLYVILFFFVSFSSETISDDCVCFWSNDFCNLLYFVSNLCLLSLLSAECSA